MLRVCAGCIVLALGVWLGAFHAAALHDADALLLRAAVAVREASAQVDVVTHALVRLIHPPVYPVVCGAIVAAGLLARRGDRAIAAAVTLAGANVTTQILKPLLAEPRFDESLARQIDPVSWPSGHATAAAAALLAALLVTPSHRRRAVALAGGLIAFGVAASVVARNWHYPSDALGGWLVAGAWASAATAWVSSRRPAPAATGAPRRRWLRATG